MATNNPQAELPGDFPIVWPQDSQFETARVGRVFNHRRPSRRPVAVVNAASEHDVIQAVKLAKNLNCKISIRSGGHSWAAWSVRDHAILVDLGQFKSIEYDNATAVVRVEPAVTSEELNNFLQTKGRLFPVGHEPTIGMGGYLYSLYMAVLIAIDSKEEWVGIVRGGDGLLSIL